MSARSGGPSAAPGLLSVPRLATLISSILVSLSSGTNYVYSAYAPQLGSKLHINHTQLNIIGLAGNVGVYSTGPFLGRFVDHKGPKMLLASAFIFLLTGYSGIRYFYDNIGGPIPDAVSLSLRQVKRADGPGISTFSFSILVLCTFLTGVGGNCGLTSAINASAKSFPDQTRATVTGLVISGFGLSAFFFSTVAHVLFPGDTSSLLLLLSLGTSFPMIVGFFLIRPIPLPAPEGAPSAERRSSLSDIPNDSFSRAAGVDGVFGGDALVYERVDDSHTHLLHSEEGSQFIHRDPETANPDSLPNSVELTRSPPADRRRRSISRVSGRRNASRVIEVMQDLKGKALLTSGDFWLLFSILSLLSGTGLMYINNIGSISQALFAQGDPDYDEVEAAKWQSMQVSTISIANFMGRVLVGLGADYTKNKLNSPRSYCLSIVSLICILSQITTSQVESASQLWKASALLGLAYGGTFGLMPTIVIEWFGLAHFSENWGFVSLSPMVGGNLFSLAFGRNLDRHAEPDSEPLGNIHSSSTPSQLLRRAGLPSSQQCFKGRECYVTSLYMTIFAGVLALALSVYAGWRDRKRMTVTSIPRGMPEVIWEEDEE